MLTVCTDSLNCALVDRDGGKAPSVSHAVGGLGLPSGPAWATSADPGHTEMKSGAVILKHQQASESPGGLVQTQISGPHSQNF